MILRRLRTSHGYGVHSPFAYDLITQVLRQRLPYYAYSELDRTLPRLARRKRRYCRLLFRLANRWQPQTIYAPQADRAERAHLHAGCRKARFVSEAPADLMVTSGAGPLPPVADGTLLVAADKAAVPAGTRVLFDAGDVRIAFFTPELKSQTYYLYL